MIAVVLLGTFGSPRRAHSQESLGSFILSGLLLEPAFDFTESRSAGVNLDTSYVEAQWVRDASLSATVKVGSVSLLGVPARYAPRSDEKFGFVEGYAQIESIYGRVRAGLVPVAFGIEGGDAETRLRFPRSLFFQNRVINLRDYGLSYRNSFQGFVSDWTIHNGESGENVDQETWFSARWGWQSTRFLKVGFSGSAGRTAVGSTLPAAGLNAVNSNAGLNPSEPARIRLANVFVSWDTHPILLEVEGSFGELRQESGERRLRTLRGDLEVMLSKSWAGLARYDTFDPHTDQESDRITDLTLGFSYRSDYENSMLSLFGTRREIQGTERPDHRLLLVWRMTPAANALQAAL